MRPLSRAPQGKLDELCDRLTDLGAEGLVIEDEADFRRFLEQNRQYWDYVDEELEGRYAGVSRVKVYVEDGEAGRERLARWTEALGMEPETRTMADEDWENNWKQYYKPIPVGESLLVCPSGRTCPRAARGKSSGSTPASPSARAATPRRACASNSWRALTARARPRSTSAAAAAYSA